MTTSELRAEAEAVQEEAGGELTTRAALLIAAADEIDSLTELLNHHGVSTDDAKPRAPVGF